MTDSGFDGKYWEKRYAEEPPSPHVYMTDEWIDRYFDEAMFHLKNRGIIIDAGCGGGHFLTRFSKNFSKVIGIDYSKIEIDKAKELLKKNNCNNVVVHNGNILDLKNYVGENTQVDSIICHSVVQFLTHPEFLDFTTSCSNLISDKGEILILNIPNFNLKDLYIVRFFKRNEKITFKTLVKEVARFKYTMFKEKIKNPKYKYNDGIGNWFTVKEEEDIV